MYNIERKTYGYKLTFSGKITPEEMQMWVEDSKKKLTSSPSSFHVFVDMRSLKTLSSEAQMHMQDGQKLYKGKGMVRSVVVVDSTITKMQFQRIAKETGIYEWERYIDASGTSNWEKVGEDWIVSEKDPDK